MGILHLHEHIACLNYMGDTIAIVEGFRFFRLNEGEVYDPHLDTDGILFVTSGKLDLIRNSEQATLHAGEMTCIVRGSTCRFRTMEKSSIGIMRFEKIAQNCEKFLITDLERLTSPIDSIYILEIRQKLRSFLSHLSECLADGAGCMHYHRLKIEEFFWLLRFYYTRHEQSGLLHPVICGDATFRQSVIRQTERMCTIKELANSQAMSLSAFKRKFIKEFNEPVGPWMKRQINKHVNRMLKNTNLTLSEIAYELNFSSQAEFCRYCKRFFGYPPRKWRKKLMEDENKIGNSSQKNDSN